MDAISLAKQYVRTDQPRIAFASNGEVGSKLVDANRDVRIAVCDACVTDPSIASDELIRDLYDAETAYAQAVFGVRHKAVAFLATQLLARGGESNIRKFLACAPRCMDSWMSSQCVTLTAEQQSHVLSTLDAIAPTMAEEILPRLNRMRGNIERLKPSN